MHALIVVGHHDPQSLTHALARQIAEEVRLREREEARLNEA